MNETQLELYAKLKEKINSSSDSGVSGERISEIKDLVAQIDKAGEETEEKDEN